MSFGVTETQWFSVTREEFCKKEGGKKGSEEEKKDWVKYRLCKFWLTDFNINDCHLITLKETQWFSTTRIFKDWKEREDCNKISILI